MTAIYKAFTKQVKNIKTQNDLKDSHIAICKACSANEISWEQFLKLCEMERTIRLEKGFTWGASI